PAIGGKRAQAILQHGRSLLALVAVKPDAEVALVADADAVLQLRADVFHIPAAIGVAEGAAADPGDIPRCALGGEAIGVPVPLIFVPGIRCAAVGEGDVPVDHATLAADDVKADREWLG